MVLSQRKLPDHLISSSLVCLLLIVGLVVAQDDNFKGSSHIHSLVETMAILLAFFAGIFTLLRSFSSSSNLYLVIGLGFVGAAVLDIYHVIIASGSFANYLQIGQESLLADNEAASRLFLATMLFSSILLWRYEQSHGKTSKHQQAGIYAATLLLLVICALVFNVMPWSRDYFAGAGIHRWEALGPALLFLLALSGYLYKGRWKNDKFEYWLILSLVLALASQALIMPFSEHDYDAHYGTAHFLKIISNFFMLVGLTFQTFQSFQREAEEGRELHRAIVNMSGEGIVTLDVNGVIETFNPAAQRLFGYSPGEIVGKNARLLIPAQDIGVYNDKLKRYQDVREDRASVVDSEIKGLHKNGSIIAIGLAVSWIKVGSEELLMAMVHDISERKQHVAELTAARKAADAANQIKSDFLATMSHEIRTPMNGVIGMSEVLRQTNLMSHQMEMVDLICESGSSLLSVIENILDFSKIEAGKMEVDSAPFAVSGVVETVCALLARLAAESGVEVTLYTDPAIPEQVLGDSQRLRQVLINLVNNSIKFSSGQSCPGRVSVRAVLVEQTAQQATVEFQVIDNGIGMDEETQARLFVPFSQADASTSRRFGGTGLGLNISRHLVKLMSGRLTLRSIPAVGTTFSVSMPFKVLPTASAAGTMAHDLAGLSCLVVGGPEGVAADLVTYLTCADAVVKQVQNLDEAQEWVHTDPAGPCILVVDAGSQWLSAEDLQVSIPFSPNTDARIIAVVIERGKRLEPRYTAPDLIRVDGNALTRDKFLKVVAIAAGREDLEEQRVELDVKRREAMIVPSREEALRQGRLILVAEDNKVNQLVIQHQLNDLGYAVDIANNGQDALNYCREVDYAMLITDLKMPKMDGYELAVAIRAEEQAPHYTPIIALTADARASEMARCQEKGMDGYLCKPARLDELKAVLQKWLPAASAEPCEKRLMIRS